jgi:hypothetical protein
LIAWVEGLAVDWIAAGHPPAAFWGQTPRAILRVLRAADIARRRHLADAAQATWVGHRANLDQLERFMAKVLSGPRPPQTPEEQALAMQNFNASIGVITMDDYRARFAAGKSA